ncbi:MAG: glucans biosynthesis glucosyltransferase MdoH [Pseudomonadota bacterium]
MQQNAKLFGKTAIVMPVYNEDPAASFGALSTMGEVLSAAGHGDAFEIFILSDTRDPTIWLRETAGFAWLRARLSGRMRCWYRRRALNIGRKSGNLQDFIERWGGRYDYMLVLDADSLMDPATVETMVRRMDAAPRLGILQSVPILAGGVTLMSRLQQFAGRLYGPVIARGVSAWQGLDGNFWGHNALIRVRAFAASCGLPTLPGRKPFGGHVLSHDFVEAALIRRAGWDVRMDTDLEGSWEGSPPSLVDLAVRDRRWAQGNLQHMMLVPTRGLRWPSRVHFLIGIGAYLMSPIWLFLLVVGMTLTAQTLIVHPQYFPDARQLFPDWPVFDAERMVWLFALSMGLLLLPKVVGLIRALCFADLRRRFGGGLRLLRSWTFEILISALYAPIQMLLQARHIYEIFTGRDSGWSAQSRDGTAMPWGEAFARHSTHMLIGLVPGSILIAIAPDQAAWLAPVLLGLLLSPLLSRLSGDTRFGAGLQRAGLFGTPEEIEEQALFAQFRRVEEDIAAISRLELLDLAQDPVLLSRHCATLQQTTVIDRPAQLAAITARAKIAAAPGPAEALEWLTPAEVSVMLGSAEILSFWANHPAAARSASA